MWLYKDFFNPFPIGKYVGCFQSLAITNTAVMNNLAFVSLRSQVIIYVQ